MQFTLATLIALTGLAAAAPNPFEKRTGTNPTGQIAHMTFHGGPASYTLDVPANGQIIPTSTSPPSTAFYFSLLSVFHSPSPKLPRWRRKTRTRTNTRQTTDSTSISSTPPTSTHSRSALSTLPARRRLCRPSQTVCRALSLVRRSRSPG